ncbi:hypothetical protein OCI51_26210 (plasmid) [Lysinibacillus capsici]|uniref:hypothetical protein n=1 Tax=Lysinibacillus capsici TaxID=2115968 RepID=UPI0021D82DDF|nr:hypothetical protein [Lysinibacillus capsici]UYB50063.1 hypothetical protein OCI51_26210 [Lysinibacillus capsici]
MLKLRKLKNPKFQEIQLTGTLIQLKHNTNKAFLIGSEQLILQYRDNQAVFQISQLSIQNVSLTLDDQSVIDLSLETIDDVQQFAHSIKTKIYWTDESFQLFALLLIRILVATVIVSQKFEGQLENLQKAKDLDWLETQYELSKLLLGLIEKENIYSSPYVVTKRAEYLLLLGLNPKEQYTSEEIRKISKVYLKKLHPDVFEGGDATFKLVNEAQRYLK